MPKEALLNQSIRVIGYPGDLTRAQPVMFEDTGKILMFNEKDFMHDANTHGGNSGAPLFIEGASYDISANGIIKKITNPIVGVHVSGANPTLENDMNHAPWINELTYDMTRKHFLAILMNRWKNFCPIQAEKN